MDEHYRIDGGRWKTLSYQRGIADAMTDPEIEEVSILKSARVGYTQLLVGYLCYRIHLDPGRFLVVQPAGDDAEGFSKEDFTPAVASIDVVRNLVGEAKSRDSDNTIKTKHFPGGLLRIGGAHTGRTFRRITCDGVIWDEVDGFPPSAGGEGDQIELGKKRAQTVAFPKFIKGSSPGHKAASRILPAWRESDRRDFLVPCPRCDHGQRLKFGTRETDYGIKWPEGRPQEAYYLCERCHRPISYERQEEMVERGLWIAGRPKVIGHAGFRIWAAYSPFPRASWGAIAEEFLRVKDDPYRLQVFWNTVLGLAWEEKFKALNEEKLMERRERYTLRVDADAKDPDYLVPHPVVTMTAGVDVHADRLECQVDGWGLGEECWKLENTILDGDPTGDIVWGLLWEWLRAPRAMERGGEDYLRATCIDAGYLGERVGHFVRKRTIYRTADRRLAYLFPIRGSAGPGDLWPRKPKRTKKGQFPLYTLKVDTAKDMISGRIDRVVEPGPGFIHFPIHRDFDERYCDQMAAEGVTLDRDTKGFLRRVWKLRSPGRRNEAWDTAVYSYAALMGLCWIGLDLDKEAERIRQAALLAPGPAPPTPPRSAAERRSPAPIAKKRKKRSRRRTSRSAYVGG